MTKFDLHCASGKTIHKTEEKPIGEIVNYYLGAKINFVGITEKIISVVFHEGNSEEQYSFGFPSRLRELRDFIQNNHSY